ncbi:MAG: DUF192 domain-containing protein [Lentisphaerae bacterium]|jgi:uncharacterized membrane protein (UPF0127 family)|nr:DUF192 domain-containing protein [Lentisphaerota bacterium]
MRGGSIVNSCGEVLVVAARRTTNVLERMRGLLGRRQLQAGEALVIEPCSAVHTVGMRYQLDLVFLDREWRVVRFVGGVRPGHLCVAGGRKAWLVVELAAGWVDASVFERGMQLRWLEERGEGDGVA